MYHKKSKKHFFVLLFYHTLIAKALFSQASIISRSPSPLRTQPFVSVNDIVHSGQKKLYSGQNFSQLSRKSGNNIIFVPNEE